VSFSARSVCDSVNGYCGPFKILLTTSYLNDFLNAFGLYFKSLNYGVE